MLRSYKSSFLVLPAILLAGLYINTNVFADSNDVDFSITVNPSLTLALSSNAVNFSITPTAQGAYNSANFTVTSATNNITGYTLVMGTSNVDLTSSTINPVTTEYPTIPTLEESQDGISAADFEASTDSTILNHYGVAIDSNNFNAMKPSQEVKKTTTNNTSGNDTTQINLASKLDLNTVPGTYSTTINFQIVANSTDPVQPYPVDPCIANPDCNPESGVTLQRAYEIAYTNAHKGMYEETTPGSNTYQYIDSWNGGQYQGEGRDVRFLIQDMTPEICATATAINSQALVLDIRDQSSYYIVKAADGRCWMQDNLALDAVANKANLSPTNTNATQAAIDNFKNGSDTAPQTGWSTGAVSYETGSSVYNQPRINVESISTVPQGSSDPLKDLANTEQWKVGVYYNYCAASIGTYCYTGGSGVDTDSASAIDVKNDICPAGWRMPTGGPIGTAGTTTEGGGEYQTLANAYPSISGGDNQYTRVRKALSLPLSGYFGNGTSNYQGSNGYFWSSTYGDSSNMYYLYVGTSSINPQSSGSRRYGNSVRCIAQ